MFQKLMAKMQNEEGQALVEYGLLVALIAVVCIAVLTILGPAIRDMFQAVVDAL
jgi:pilus assembly protein Flp/PilA